MMMVFFTVQWFYICQSLNVSVTDLDKLVEICEQQLAAVVKKPIAKGQSVVEAAPAPWKQTQATPVLPFELLQNGLYCQYCR